jgi:tetratricopeptide (TPR) repeat protein
MRAAARVAFLSAALAACAPAHGAGDLEIAREALRDGLWTLAREYALKAGGEDACRLILESYAREGDWEGVSRTLASITNSAAPAFGYYRAAAAGDCARALEILRESGATETDADSKMFEADMLLKSGDRAAAEKVWREVVAMTNAGERAFADAGARLGDVDALRLAYANASRAAVRRFAGLQLGVLLLKDAGSRQDGERLVRAIVKNAPDCEGAREAFLAVAQADIAAGRWSEALAVYHEAVETWPDCAKMVQVQEGRGWACIELGRLEEALDAFRLAEALAADDERKAAAVLKQGDVYSKMGKGDAAMSRYRDALGRFPETAVAGKLRKIVHVRELEAKGRDLYKAFRFAEAKEVFAQVAAEDPQKRPRMEFFGALCLYGQGLDDAALAKALAVAQAGTDVSVRADAALWAAKFLYNRCEWKESERLFLAYSEMKKDGASVPEAMMWAARSAFSANDYQRAIQIATALAQSHPAAPQTVQALIVQGEALIELARFEEAVLVLDHAALAENAPAQERVRARLLKADALFATGADNPARYAAALETYRAVIFGGTLSVGGRIAVSFKIAKALEKLKRVEEAIEQYYTQVVLAYREARAKGERLDDGARAAFSRAAFRLADEYESRGRDYQAIHVLELVATSDVPAAGEAEKRIGRISMKGGFL